MLITLFSTLSVIKLLIGGNKLNWLLNLNLCYKTLWAAGREWLIDFDARKTQLMSFDRFNKCSAIYVRIDRTVLDEPSPFKDLGLSFSSKFNLNSYFVSIAKTAAKKIGTLIHSMIVFCLYKSTTQPSMKYFHVCAGAYNCYLDVSEKLQNWVCRDVGPRFPVPLNPLAHCRNVTRLRRNYFGRSSPELAELVQLCYSPFVILMSHVSVNVA